MWKKKNDSRSSGACCRVEKMQIVRLFLFPPCFALCVANSATQSFDKCGFSSAKTDELYIYVVLFFFSSAFFVFCRCCFFFFSLVKKKKKGSYVRKKKKEKRKCESADTHTHVLIQTEIVAPSKEQVRLLKQKQRADKTHIFYKHFALSAVSSTLLIE